MFTAPPRKAPNRCRPGLSVLTLWAWMGQLFDRSFIMLVCAVLLLELTPPLSQNPYMQLNISRRSQVGLILLESPSQAVVLECLLGFVIINQSDKMLSFQISKWEVKLDLTSQIDCSGNAISGMHYPRNPGGLSQDP
jgi:hypothetical protein